mmetsp:Transcript_655/g.1842  ORF Transcript_655/g.1842 Transcript_655/m.1842 type:complete len:340 (-) Transcript_655:158-1177(-)
MSPFDLNSTQLNLSTALRLWLLIKVVQSLLESVGITLGLGRCRTPRLLVIGDGRWQRLSRHDGLDVVLDVGGQVLARVAAQRNSRAGIDEELLEVAFYSAQSGRSAAVLLQPSPEGMGSRAEEVDLVGEDGGRVDAVSVLRCQLQTDQRRCVWFVISLVAGAEHDDEFAGTSVFGRQRHELRNILASDGIILLHVDHQHGLDACEAFLVVLLSDELLEGNITALHRHAEIVHGARIIRFELRRRAAFSFTRRELGGTCGDGGEGLVVVGQCCVGCDHGQDPGGCCGHGREECAAGEAVGCGDVLIVGIVVSLALHLKLKLIGTDHMLSRMHRSWDERIG